MPTTEVEEADAHKMIIDYNEYLRFEVEVPTEGLPNLVQNPSGEKAASGWVTPVDNTFMYVGSGPNGTTIAFKTTVSQASYFTTEFMPVAATKYVTGRYDIDEISASHNVKVRYEWYNSSKVLLSSSIQGSATSALTTHYTGTFQAPANTAYVKIRFDFYNGVSNPSANAYVDLQKVMVTWQDTGTITTQRTNRILNPGFQVSASNWAVSDSHGTLARSTAQSWVGDGSGLITPGGAGNYGIIRTGTGTGGMPVTGGKDYTFSYYYRQNTAINVLGHAVTFYKANGTVTGPNQAFQTSPASSINTWIRRSMPFTAPSDAAFAMVQILTHNVSMYVDGIMFEEGASVDFYFDGDNADTAGVDYAWTGTAHQSASTRTTTSTTTFDYSEPFDWQNILGPTNSISVGRKEMDVGITSVVVYDAILDPAYANPILKPGKKVRLRAYSEIDDEWGSVYEGTIKNALATYDKRREGNKSVQITVTTNDNITLLANQSENRVVADTDDLPFLLEGKGVPWSINGSGNQVTSATVVAYNEASVLSQVAVTRDSNLAFAWVDRANVLNVFDEINMPVGTQPEINGTFDVDVSGWSATNGTLTRDTSIYQTAPASMRVTATAAGDVVVTTPTGTNGFRIGSNQEVSLSYGVRAGTTSRSVTRTYKFYDASGAGIATSSAGASDSTSWQQRFSTSSREGAAYVAVEFTIVGAAAGESHYFDDITLTIEPTVTFTDVGPMSDDVVSYSDIDTSYNTDDFINQVTVKFLQYDIGTGQTQEIAYGPYVDQDSINDVGAFAAEFTIAAAVEDPVAIAAYAQSILDANSQPVIKVNSLTMPVRNATEIHHAMNIDLYSLVKVVHDDKIDGFYRVTGIEHNINPDLWTVTYTFADTGSVAMPTVTPSPTAFTGVTERNWQVRQTGGGTSITSATFVDLPSMTQVIGVNSTNDVYLVTVTMDCAQTLTNTQTLVGYLNIDGTDQTGQLLYRAPAANNRATVQQTWLVTGLTSGNHTLKVRANLTGTGAYTVSPVHSQITIVRIT